MALKPWPDPQADVDEFIALIQEYTDLCENIEHGLYALPNPMPDDAEWVYQLPLDLIGPVV
jgi:hypothetical protein